MHKAKKNKKEKLDRYHFHELLDRTYMIVDSFDAYVAEHPAAKQNPEITKACEDAEDALMKVYRLASAAGEAFDAANPTAMQDLANIKSQLKAVRDKRH